MSSSEATHVHPWDDSVTPVGPPAEASPRTAHLLYAGVVTGVWAGVICLVLYLVGRLIRVPFELAAPGSTVLGAVPWFVVLLVPIAAGVGGALLSALVLGRRHAGRIVFWTGTALALLSLWWPLLGQPEGTLWSSRIWLSLLHVVTWLLVVPQLARIVGDSEPGQSRQLG